MDVIKKMKGGVEAKKNEALTMVKGEVEAKKEAIMKVKEGVQAKTEEALRKVKEGLGAKTEEALMTVIAEVEEKKDEFMKVKEDVEAKRETFMKVKEEVDAMKREASMMAKEGLEAKAEEALRKLMKELEAKRDAFMKVKEDVEAKKEAFMKVMEVAEANKKDALMMMKEGVEANTEEALMKVFDEVENKKEAFMKVKKDVEEKIEPVKTFILGALACHSSKIGDTVPSILYPVVNSPPVDVPVQQSHVDGTSYTGNKHFKGFSSSTQNIQEQNGTYTDLEKGSTSGNGIETLGSRTAEGTIELCLENLYQQQESQEFYCPHCNTRIKKVLIKPPEEDIFRFTNCFAFLVPGEFYTPMMLSCILRQDLAIGYATYFDQENKILKSIVYGGLAESITSLGIVAPAAAADAATCKCNINRTDGSFEIPMPPDEQQPARAEPRSSKSWQILKSIVYGGLAESITSLGIVTSAASADAATCNILLEFNCSANILYSVLAVNIMALALANLIGGLFTIIHNLWEFKNDDSTVKSEDTGLQVNRYQEIMGRKENFCLHATAAILSFLIFGLVPPVVYGFTFLESDDKDLKIAAVAGASLICITLLALAKARTQSNPKYILTVVQYVGVGIGVSVASYVAGDLLDRLLEQLGWFQQTHGDKTFPLPQFMSM
ncbi:hypothetical protein FEM48_Zijuj09G0080100 [Ziziphus jujuba var. spinosa]|uniref:Membrane protein of ER body-like protein n=1 Tax=Ziziphus jujuba var. spinosa TaxID=714518 RepID=A0A978URT0_ZIZJJ|nr:hypothetical protein FEM48_Zijuj09G0080100 [Ziziphus jujuba var. spinosa]